MNSIINKLLMILFSVLIAGCVPQLSNVRTEKKTLPGSYNGSPSTLNSAEIKWREYFNDPDLAALIDTALKNNQELNIILQEIEISQNEVRVKKGMYLPFIGLKGAAEMEKEGWFTRVGAIEKNIEIRPGEEFPEPFTDYLAGAFASWEIDVWKKLRNSKKAAVTRYLAGVEGKNFMITNLIAEISNSYYELLALDNQLDIIESNIKIQSDAIRIIRQQKDAAKVTQLAVNRFEAQLLKTQNLQFEIKQKITETENRINFLTGRFPQPVKRDPELFNRASVDTINAGIPSDLLSRRTDIRKAELEIAAARLDLNAARADFYPEFKITSGVGFHAFKPSYLFNPESIIYSLAGDLVAPVINRNAIKAEYYSANARQIQAIYNFEKTILNAFVEVANELSKIDNYSRSFSAKEKEVGYLSESVSISDNLFKAARADYLEVLLTQREVLEARIELVEIKLKQMNAKVNIYQALGGGWN